MAVIYKIKNISNDKIYIGSAINCRRRWESHKSHLRLNKHGNKHLQNAWNLYGEYNFIFEIIEEILDPNQLLTREQYHLDTLLFAQNFIKNIDNRFLELGYNLLPTAGNSFGHKHTEESINKMRLAKFGKKNTITHNLNIKNNAKYNINYGHRGKLMSEEFKGKISKPIIQCDLMGNHIREYPSLILASRDLKIPISGISQCCRGRINTSKGFIWKFKEKDNKSGDI